MSSASQEVGAGALQLQDTAVEQTMLSRRQVTNAQRAGTGKSKCELRVEDDGCKSESTGESSDDEYEDGEKIWLT